MEFLSVKLQTFKKNKKRRSLLFEKKKYCDGPAS